MSRALTLAGPGIVDPTGPLAAALPTSTVTSTFTLTAAQVIAMNAAPITLIAGVAGQVLIPTAVVLKLANPSATPFTGGGQVQLGAASLLTSIAASTAVVTTALAASYLASTIAVAASAVDLRGLPLVISNATAAFAAGTGCTLAVTVTYTVLTSQ